MIVIRKRLSFQNDGGLLVYAWWRSSLFQHCCAELTECYFRSDITWRLAFILDKRISSLEYRCCCTCASWIFLVITPIAPATLERHILLLVDPVYNTYCNHSTCDDAVYKHSFVVSFLWMCFNSSFAPSHSCTVNDCSFVKPYNFDHEPGKPCKYIVHEENLRTQYRKKYLWERCVLLLHWKSLVSRFVHQFTVDRFVHLHHGYF